MRRCALVLATTLLSVTALAGCGSADEEAADDTETTTSSSTEDESPDTEDSTDDTGDAPGDKSGSDKQEEPAEKNKSGDADDSKKKPDDSGTTKQAKADYCDLVKSLKADFDPSNSASLAASRDLDAVVDRLEEVGEQAPAKVRPAWQRLIATFEGFGNLVDKYDIDLADPQALNKLKPKETRALTKAIQKYQTPQVAKATSTIESDVKRRCNVTMG